MLPIMLADPGTFFFRPVDAHPNPRRGGVRIMLAGTPQVEDLVFCGEASRKHQSGPRADWPAKLRRQHWRTAGCRTHGASKGWRTAGSSARAALAHCKFGLPALKGGAADVQNRDFGKHW